MARTAVRVALRVKPLKDINKDGCSITFVKDEPQIIIGNKKSFNFDFVFPPETSQQELYEHSILPLVDRFVEGNNVVILAFGQTGSGKTYSMGTGIDQTKQVGIIPRFAHSLFEHIIEHQNKTFEIYASYLELYNEAINDLLISTEMIHQQQDHPTVSKDVDGKIHWTGMKEQRIYTADDLMRCLKHGSQRRTAGSSSHAIFSITLTQQTAEDTSMFVEDKDDAVPRRVVSRLYFVDRAGSEERQTDRQKEEIIGNGGLSALDSFVSALGGERHVPPPHKESKLTSLLQDSLGGNSHTLLLACVNAASADYTETLNTLECANRVCNIPNKQANELQTLRDETSPQESQWSREPSQTTASGREALLLGRDAHYAQNWRPLSAETRNSSAGRDFSSRLQSPPKVSSSMGFLDKKKLFVDSSNITKKCQGSVSSSRRLTSKKKPVIQRMRTQSSPALKRRQTHETMDELLTLLRAECYGSDSGFHKSTDETVLHDASHAGKDTAATSLLVSKENNLLPSSEAETNNRVFPAHHTQKHSMPADSTIICPPSNTLDDDELEALAVPCWSDVPKLPSINGSIKRKSISLDSMWDDTDSSITTSRVEPTATPRPSQHYHQQQQKDTRRSSRSLLKMLHQIQADLLVKRELVGQLERSEDQYTQMRLNYESRLNELKDHLLEIQNQRDAALRQSGATIVSQLPKRPQTVLQLRENRQAQEVRAQYEQKIKRLISENADLRKKTTQSTQSVHAAQAKAEGTIGRLRADIEALKLDKKQLHKSLKLEADKAREAAAAFEKETAQLKRKVLSALDAKKKVEETNNAQSQLLAKRNQETLAANTQLRHLTTALRRAASEGTFLNEVALEKIFADAASLKSASSANNHKPVAASRTHSPANL